MLVILLEKQSGVLIADKVLNGKQWQTPSITYVLLTIQ